MQRKKLIQFKTSDEEDAKIKKVSKLFSLSKSSLIRMFVFQKINSILKENKGAFSENE